MNFLNNFNKIFMSKEKGMADERINNPDPNNPQEVGPAESSSAHPGLNQERTEFMGSNNFRQSVGSAFSAFSPAENSSSSGRVGEFFSSARTRVGESYSNNGGVGGSSSSGAVGGSGESYSNNGGLGGNSSSGAVGGSGESYSNNGGVGGSSSSGAVGGSRESYSNNGGLGGSSSNDAVAPNGIGEGGVLRGNGGKSRVEKSTQTSPREVNSSANDVGALNPAGGFSAVRNKFSHVGGSGDLVGISSNGASGVRSSNGVERGSSSYSNFKAPNGVKRPRYISGEEGTQNTGWSREDLEFVNNLGIEVKSREATPTRQGNLLAEAPLPQTATAADTVTPQSPAPAPSSPGADGVGEAKQGPAPS